MSAENRSFTYAKLEKIEEPTKFPTFELLVLDVNKRTREAFNMRVGKTGFRVTEFEYALGCFTEKLQPFLKDAIISIQKKGYCLGTWGFVENHLDTQQVTGIFRIKDEEARNKLQQNNIRIIEEEFNGLRTTELSFKASKPSYKELKKKWDTLAEILPDTGEPMQNRWHMQAVEFRRDTKNILIEK